MTPQIRNAARLAASMVIVVGVVSGRRLGVLVAAKAAAVPA